MPRTKDPSNVDPERQLMIKTKTCQRLIKEVAHYKDEVQINEIKVVDMKNDSSKDIYDVKRYEEILNESYMMVPDSLKRLQSAIDDLSSYVTNNDSVLDTAGLWYLAAQAILQDNQNVTLDTGYSGISNYVSPILETHIDDLADGEAF